jgi:S-adenosylmethionine decarboxylase
MLKELHLDNYLFGAEEKDLKPAEKKQIKRRLKREMLEIFYAQNLTKMPE